MEGCVFLTRTDLKTLADERNTENVRELLNVKAWSWFVENYYEPVGQVWLQVRVYTHDVHSLFVKLFGIPPTDRFMSILEETAGHPGLFRIRAWQHWDEVKDRFKIKILGKTIFNLAPLFEEIVIEFLVGDRPDHVMDGLEQS